MKEYQVSISTLAEHPGLGSPALRNEPVQARSTARLAGLLDAAAAVIDELGYERLTTAMVAERAGASIGTVYRYFPDRIAVLQALAARNLERTLAKVTQQIANEKHSTWAEAVDAGFDVFIEAFRNEPGFRSLRVGDVVDLQPSPNDRTYNSLVAETMLSAVADRFGLEATEEALFSFEVAVETSDALASRAFTFDSRGDEAFLSAARESVHSQLASTLGARA
jgi:AcrR family transcriptional regulator